jgi:thymidine phosphorylase
MLVAAGVEPDHDAAVRRLERAIGSGAARAKFAEIIEAQGGNPALVEDPSGLPQAQAVEVYLAPSRGYVERVEPRPIGEAIVALGGGRRRLGEAIDHSVGFVITVKPGDHVAAGEPIASIFAKDQAGLQVGAAALERAIVIGEQGESLPLLSHRVTAAGVEVIRSESRSTARGTPVAGG